MLFYHGVQSDFAGKWKITMLFLTPLPAYIVFFRTEANDYISSGGYCCFIEKYSRKDLISTTLNN